MNTSIQNNYDSTEQVMINKYFEIKNLAFDTSDKLLFVVLNTGNVLAIGYGHYSRLKIAGQNQLSKLPVD